jgi:hypothetical protein
MIKITRYLVAVPALFLAVSAMAESPSFNFIQVGYQSVEIDLGDGFDVDGDGFALGGSFEIGDNMFGFASYGKTDFDFDVELTQLQVGFGARVGISDRTDFFARAAYVEGEVSAPGFIPVDDNGYGLGIGVRSNVSDLVELYAEIAYVDLGDDADSTAFGGGIWFNLNETFALGLGASAEDDVTLYGASARVYFGR